MACTGDSHAHSYSSADGGHTRQSAQFSASMRRWYSPLQMPGSGYRCTVFGARCEAQRANVCVAEPGALHEANPLDLHLADHLLGSILNDQHITRLAPVPLEMLHRLDGLIMLKLGRRVPAIR
jgi:hypothetical protein